MRGGALAMVSKLARVVVDASRWLIYASVATRGRLLVICPSCRAENRDGRRFCGECGAALPVSCAACGFPNEPGAKFCGGCGQSLAAPRSPQPVPVSPQSYTPKHLAERILTSKASIEGERKRVTVLFADLKGSMELLAGRDPEEARELLDAVLARMMEAVHQHEGTVNQVMGDGIMALFGAPLALEEHAVRACLAALAMQDSIGQYARETGRSDVRVRVGLNSGEVVVRAIGSDLRMDYTAVGQTTHLAARMEQLATPGTIVMTADTLRLVEGYVQARPLGPSTVKGFPEPLEVFELEGVAENRTRLQVSAARGLTPFVGRQREFDVLPHALARAAEQKGQVVAVVGEAGVGKSRLLWEFTRSGRVDGWVILESRSVSSGKATPYFPVIELLKTYFGVEERDDRPRIRDRVDARLADLGPGADGIRSPLLALLHADPEDPHWERLEPAQRRQRTMDSVKRLLIRQSQLQPLLVVFEDLHWIDSETQALLDSLVESLRAARLLLLVNYRPEYQHAWGGKSYFTQIRIDPLTPQNAEALLEALLGAGPELKSLKERLIERTEGNPFFLEESVRTLAETAILVGERGAYGLARPVSMIEIPGTVQAILAARIDRLPSEEKQLLQSAAVIGKDFQMVLLRAITGAAEEDLRLGLQHLQASEFLYETSLFPELEYTFKHALTHDVAYGSLLHDRRRALHGQIVDVMEQLYASRLLEQVERVAHHANRGERWEKAVTYHWQAGLKAQARSAQREAVLWFTQALQALRRVPEGPQTWEQAIDLRLDLRASLYPLGEFDAILGHLAEAEEVARRANDDRRLGWISLHKGDYCRHMGRFTEACSFIEEAYRIAGTVSDVALRLAASHHLGLARAALGDSVRAAELLRTIVEAPADEIPAGGFGRTQGGSRAGFLAVNLGWLGRFLADCGEFEEATGVVRRGRAIADDLRTPYSLTATAFSEGYVHAARGSFAEALIPLEEALGIAREWGITLYEAHIMRVLGWTYACSGRTAEGVAMLRQAVDAVEARSLRSQHASAVVLFGEACLLDGRLEEAAAAADHALTLARARQQRGEEAFAQRLRGEIATRTAPSDPEAAERHYAAAIAAATELRIRPLQARCQLGLARHHLACGHPAIAEEHLVSALELFWAMDMRFWVRQTLETMTGSGRLLIIAREQAALFDYLQRVLTPAESVRVSLDRRSGQPRDPVLTERRGDREAQARLQRRGMIIVPEG
jgi:class 3 adenylate cyclase/tetratricopeptide (TPR) repeat protein